MKRLLIAIRDALLTPVNRVRIALGLDGSSAVSYWKRKGERHELTDAQVDGYDARHEELRPILEEMSADLAAHVMPELKPGKAVLDFGCGTGRHYAAFYGLPGVRAVGIDVSGPILDRFTRPKFPEGEFHAIDLTQDDSFVSANEGAFAAVYSMSVIEYVRPSRLPALVRTLGRLLEPGGVLYLAFPHAQTWRSQVADLGYVRYRPEVVECYVAGAGLEVSESYSVHHRERISGIDRSGKPNYGYVVVGRKA